MVSSQIRSGVLPSDVFNSSQSSDLEQLRVDTSPLDSENIHSTQHGSEHSRFPGLVVHRHCPFLFVSDAPLCPPNSRRSLHLLMHRLYGFTCAQTLYYFYHYHGDRYVLKAWVIVQCLFCYFGLFISGCQVMMIWSGYSVHYDNLESKSRTGLVILPSSLQKGM